MVSCLIAGCLTAPDLNRDNILDKKAGIPYINDLRYFVDHRGVILNWTDGSLQNDLYLIKQVICDNSGNEPDSLVKTIQLEPDSYFFFDASFDFGYPYTVYLSSQILDGSKIKAEIIDTVNIEFGKLTFSSQYIRNNILYINWQNFPNRFHSDSILIDKLINDQWQLIDRLDPKAKSFRYPVSSTNTGDMFRISSTVINFNGLFSRTSSFEVVVD
jgi:hypothetical protein